MTIKILVEEWQEYQIKTGRLSAKSIRTYRHYLDRFLLAHPEYKLSDLSTRACRLYIAEETARSKHVGAGSLAALRSLVRYAIAEGYLNADPTLRIETISPPRGNRRAHPADTIRKLFAAIEKRRPSLRPKSRAMLSLMVYGGLRVSEVAAFRLSDLTQETGKLVIPKGKGGKPRTIYVPSECIEAISAWSKEGKESFGMKADGVRAVVASLCRFAGTGKVLPHELRHSCASRLLTNGETIKTVQEFLGHSSIATTGIYLHSTEETMRDAAKSASLNAKPRQGKPLAHTEREKPEAKEQSQAQRGAVRFDGRRREEEQPKKRIQRFTRRRAA